MSIEIITIGVVYGICSGPILNQGKLGTNQEKMGENDYPDLLDTLYANT